MKQRSSTASDTSENTGVTHFTTQNIDREKPNYALSSLEEDILTILTVHASYGLEISKAIEKASNGTRKIGVGSLYPSLRRLEQKGFVTSFWESNGSEREGARRRYYEISPSGRRVLDENQNIRKNLLQWQLI